MSTITKIIRVGNSQAVRIPARFAFNGTDEVEIERVGEELHIRPVRRSLAGAAALFAAFPPDFMSGVERDQDQAERDQLYRPPAP